MSSRAKTECADLSSLYFMLGISLCNTQHNISFAEKKGGSAFIPGLKTGDFPLHPLHHRKLNTAGGEGKEYVSS